MQPVKTAKPFDAKDRATTRHFLPLVALGGGLAAGPAAALELGDVTVHSNLGQPLRASIAYALAPNEMLSNTCVSVNANGSTGGLPGIGPNSVSITESAIVITGKSVVREPMLGTRITINCPYTPNLSREYMLFVDPATVAAARANAAAPVARREAAPATRPAARTAVRRATPADTTPIGQSTRYRVQPGDTLGDIVRRIENRSMALWPAVNRVFAANPGAFIDNDPNKLKAGSWLDIPSFDGSAPAIAATAPGGAVATDTPAADAGASTTESLATRTVAAAAASEAVSAYDMTATSESAAVPATAAAPADSAAVVDSTADLQPGDVILDATTPVEAGEIIAIPDTALEGPRTASASPNVPTQIVSTGSRSESTSLFVWLIGGGLAIIAALVLFGRRIRGRFGSTPVGPVAAESGRRASDHAEAVADDYDIDDDSPTEENLALDADLVTGSGLADGTDMDVAQDFGFAATADLDYELPFEPEAAVPEHETDILPPMRAGMGSILESEVLPEDDDYDMSVIVDATQMPQPEDVTERDFKAVEVGAADDTRVSGSYTISNEVDYDILEQDYEEELSATQALNMEIERAAAELAGDLGEITANLEQTESTAEMPADDRTVEMPTDEPTSEMPLATVTELDATAEMPARKDDDATELLAADNDPNDTAAVTVNMTADDATAEMPVANDDETAEMEIESGRVDTKRG